MFSSDENFQPFRSHRFEDGANDEIFEIGNKKIISPEKNAVFTFFHLLNRTVTSVPWVFWLQLIISFLQLAIAVLSPFNNQLWEIVPKMKPLNRILVFLVRIVHPDAPFTAEISMFSIYAAITIFLTFSTALIIHLIKEKKEVDILIKIYFFIFAVFMPIFRTSMICLFSNQMLTIIRKPSLSSFLLSLFSLICILLHFLNTIVFSFASATSPHPNMHNPMAIWCPSAMHSVEFEVFIIFNFFLLEVTRNIKPLYFGIVLAIYTVVVLIPQFFWHRSVTYFILFFAYEFMYTILLATALFEIVVVAFAIARFEVPFEIVITMWVVTPAIIFVIVHLIIQWKIKKITKTLDENIPETIEDTSMEREAMQDSFENLVVSSPSWALKMLRVAFIKGHPIIDNLSLIRHFIEKFPEIHFEIIHMAFLIPGQYNFVTSEISIFLDKTQTSFLQDAILFQIIISQEESSNDLSKQLAKEVSSQLVQSNKAQQVQTKIWSACLKGDVTAMSRYAFTLNKIIKNLNKKWSYLAMRYPFSDPILKSYVNFLKTTGCQHARAEAICQMNPKLIEQHTVCQDNSINSNLLRQSVEEAVNRRPVVTARGLSLYLGFGVALMTLVMIATVLSSAYILGRYEGSVKLLTSTVGCLERMSHAPNIFSKIAEIHSNPMSKEELNSRNELYEFTKELSDCYNILIDKIPNSALVKMKTHPEYMLFAFANYSAIKKSTLIGTLSQFIYYENSLSYVTKEDDLVGMINNNLDNASNLIISTTSDIIIDVEDLYKKISYFSYVFFAVSLSVILFVFFPLFILQIRKLKDEMHYLFSLYLTIPHSTLTKFIEAGNAKKGDYRTVSAMLTTSTYQGQGSTTDLETETTNVVDEKVNVADTFKVIVNENSNNQDLLPPCFTCKALTLLFIATSLPLAIGIINIAILDFQTKEFNKCMETIRVISLRTHKASAILHGMLTNTSTINNIKKDIEDVMVYHSALLFTNTDKLSKKMFNSEEFQKYHFNNNCTSEKDCKTLTSLFDELILYASNVSNSKIPNRNDSMLLSVRDMYNNELFPIMEQLQNSMTSYVINELSFYKMLIIIMCVAGIILLLFLFSTFALPVINELKDAVMSVKLPLKFIDPIDLADQGKLMLYLQGECDYGSEKISETKSSGPSGALFLNAITSPFAVFESDLSLLFANNAFYQLLNTSREATVGLPLVDIFSHVMPFKTDENHPFNSLLETIEQLQRGVAAHNFAEIVTEFDIRERSTFPIMIRLVGVNSSNDMDDVDSENIKATQYIVNVTNLTAKRDITDKLLYEATLAKKIMDHSIDPILLKSLTGEDKVLPKKYVGKPILVFNIKQKEVNDENNDDILVAFSIFTTIANDINPSYGSVSKLALEAPNWFYIGGANQDDDDINIGIDELTQFGLHVLEIFSQSFNKQTITLSATIHISDFTVIPINFDPPVLELLGKGYSDLMAFQEVGIPGKLIATSEAEEVLSTFKNVILSPGNSKFNGSYYYIVEKLIEEKDEFVQE